MTPENLLDHLRSESARFRDVLADCAPDARVPTCPDWTATDLLWHLGAHVQAFWAHVVTTRPAPPADWDEDPVPTGPEAHAQALARFDEAHAALVSALEAADPADAAWTWSADQTVGFTYRRQAHEALIHRVDAELVAGLPVGPVDPALAVDGVDEVLSVMFGGTPSWGSFTPDHRYVRFDMHDTGSGTGSGSRSIWATLGRFTGTNAEGTSFDEVDIDVVADPGVDPKVVVRGPAAQLVLWLWRRGERGEIEVEGDDDTAAVLLTYLDQPID